MNMRQVIMNEKTRITLSTVGWISMILFVISATAAGVTWKTDAEHGIESNRSSIQDIRHDNDIEHEKMSEEISDIKPDIIEIKTDLKWIRAFMEKE